MSLDTTSRPKRLEFTGGRPPVRRKLPPPQQKKSALPELFQPGKFQSWLALHYQSTLDSYQRFDSITLWIGLGGAVGMPLYYFIWHDFFPQPYENLTLRLIGAVFCLLLASKELWPSNWRPVFAPIVWYATLVYSLPFFFTFMLLMNGGSSVWLVTWLCGFFMLVVAVSWTNLVLFLVVGITGAFIAYGIQTEPGAEFSHLVDQVPVFLFALVAGTLFIYRQGVARKARFNAMFTISHGLSREIKTPLRSVTTIVLGLKQYLPVLLDAHALAKAHGLSVQDLPHAHRDALKQAASRIQSELHRVSASLQMLMDNSEEVDFQSLPRTSLSIRECVRTAISRFPFSSDAQRRLVKWRGGDDFTITANEGIMVRVLMNLIKAALMGVTRMGRGEVNIRLEASRTGNRLVVQLVGWSIPVRLLGRVFEEASFLESGSGTGSGLFFLKRAMGAIGGQAMCEALPGAHTNFILEFPLPAKDAGPSR